MSFYKLYLLFWKLDKMLGPYYVLTFDACSQVLERPNTVRQKIHGLAGHGDAQL